MEEDPNREIYGYTDDFKVPTWHSSKSVSTCTQCTGKFSAIHKQQRPHNCRLCGLVFCSSCTKKYHLPARFELKKGKEVGTSRVCSTCVNHCLKRRADEQQAEYVKKHGIKHQILSLDDLTEKKTQDIDQVSKPVWQNITKTSSCSHCSKSSVKLHNCRLCGIIYCSTCTSKCTGIPLSFDNKHKKGAMRTCKSCEVRLKRGVTFVEESPAPAAPVGACTHPGCTKSRVSAQGFCAQHAPANDTIAAAATVLIKWSSDMATVAKIAIDDKASESTLEDVERKVKAQCPSLPPYSYVFRSKIISPAFYSVFTTRVLGPVIYIVKKIDDMKIKRVRAPTQAGKMLFQMKDTDERKEPIVVATPAPIISVFHAPSVPPRFTTLLTTRQSITSSSSAAPPPPPPPPPCSEDMLTADVDFHDRARALFGAI